MQVAQRYAETTRGVVTFQMHRVFDVHDPFRSRHEDIVMNGVYDDGVLVRVHVISDTIDGKPANASDIPSECPFRTALMRIPMATANAAGSTPSNNRPAHHAAASPRLAFGSTLKNFHSFRSVIATRESFSSGLVLYLNFGPTAPLMDYKGLLGKMFRHCVALPIIRTTEEPRVHF